MPRICSDDATSSRRRMLSRLGRIEGKLDAFIKQMEAHDNRTTDIEARTRKVETGSIGTAVPGRSSARCSALS
jgi:hypothetical protein